MHEHSRICIFVLVYIINSQYLDNFLCLSPFLSPLPPTHLSLFLPLFRSPISTSNLEYSLLPSLTSHTSKYCHTLTLARFRVSLQVKWRAHPTDFDNQSCTKSCILQPPLNTRKTLHLASRNICGDSTNTSIILHETMQLTQQHGPYSSNSAQGSRAMQ